MVGLERCEPSMWTSIFVVSCKDFIGQYLDNDNEFLLTLLPDDNTMSVFITPEAFPSSALT